MQTTSTKTSVFLLTIVVFLIGSVNTKYPRTNMAGIWYVSTSGNDSHSCTSPSAPCATIDSAIQKASPGDTILVSTGSYTVSQMSIVNISKNITLSGGWNSAFTVQNGYSIIDGTKTNYTIIRGITVLKVSPQQ